MDGIVDIYMPDFKFWDPESARRYAKAPDYPETARSAIKEMHRQVGLLVVDEQGIALRGVLLRHLIMPGGVAGTPEIMNWVGRELGPETYVNLMAQYHPAGRSTAVLITPTTAKRAICGTSFIWSRTACRDTFQAELAPKHPLQY